MKILEKLKAMLKQIRMIDQETMDLIAKIRLEKGQITQDEYDEEKLIVYDKSKKAFMLNNGILI